MLLLVLFYSRVACVDDGIGVSAVGGVSYVFLWHGDIFVFCFQQA